MFVHVFTTSKKNKADVPFFSGVLDSSIKSYKIQQLLKEDIRHYYFFTVFDLISFVIYSGNQAYYSRILWFGRICVD